MHQSERPSTMLVILFWPLAGSHCTDWMASRAAPRKPSTETNHCDVFTHASALIKSSGLT